MALKLCSNCGKKVSDTVERCIHCGAVIEAKKEKTQEAFDTSEKNDVSTKKNDGASKKKPSKKYFSMKLDDRVKLEEEFLHDDEIAMKWYRKSYISRKIRKLGACAWFTHSVVAILAAVFGTDMIAPESELNEIFLTISLLCVVVLVLGGLLTVVLTFIANRIFLTKIKQYTYMKRFKAWLAEKKHIDYNMTFDKVKDKELFESIDINIRTI